MVEVSIDQSLWEEFKKAVGEEKASETMEKLMKDYLNKKIITIEKISDWLGTKPFIIKHAKALDVKLEYEQFGIVGLLLEEDTYEEAKNYLLENKEELESLLGIAKSEKGEVGIWLLKLAGWFGPFGGVIVEGEPRKYIEPNFLVGVVNKRIGIEDPFAQFLSIKDIQTWLSKLREIIKEGYIESMVMVGLKPRRTSIVIKDKEKALRLCDIIMELLRTYES